MSSTRTLPFRRKPLSVGISETFFPDEYDRVERVVEDLRALGVEQLRTVLSWAEWWESPGREWYEWLVPRLAREFELLPCFVCTPPSYGEVATTSAPPREPNVFADFLTIVMDRLGEHFDWVELWNEPNNPAEWDPIRDPGWQKFARTIKLAAKVAHSRGKRTVLGGMNPIDPNWLWVMFDHGVMDHIDVVGVHGFPGTYEVHWDGWGEEVARVRRVLDEHGSRAGIWVTEAGFSTVTHDQYGQVRAMSDLLDAPVDRAYWSSLWDLAPERESAAGFHVDERDYHCGIKTARGGAKLLYRLWHDYGLEGVREAASWPQVYLTRSTSDGRVLVTGGAGFLGTHVAHRLASEGRKIRILDNLSRPGVERNLRWLQRAHPGRVEFEGGDVRDRLTVDRAVQGVDRVYHFAAQPGVPTSVLDPLLDFQVNLMGTLNVLEALRGMENPPSLVYASSTRVYGPLEGDEVAANGRRYGPVDPELRERGIDERRRLDVRTPFGCSKSAADRYVLDYSRTMGLRTTVLRLGTIFGSRQLGSEEQGWVAHSVLRTVEGVPVVVPGDGKQVQDVLWVDDFVEALLLAERQFDRLVGHFFNLGGGPERTLSVLELLDLLEELHGSRPRVSFTDWQPGQQRWFASDTRRFGEVTGWKAHTSIAEGVRALYDWARERLEQAEAEATVTHES